MTTDVVYRLGPRGDNDPLRYSLRSLANVEHGDVHVIGRVPKWLTNVNVLTPSPKRYNVFRNSVHALYAACLQLAGRRFILVDDDTYILRPIAEVRPLHAEDMLTAADHKSGAYGRTFRWTVDWLAERGIESPLSYELHVPMPIVADDCAPALEPARNASRAVQARSIYGNTCNIGGEYADDVKTGTLPDGDYFSTSRENFALFHPTLAALFPTRSEYEGGGK
jgi:hypothetical protein